MIKKILFGLVLGLIPVFVFASVSELEFVSPEQVVAPGEMSGTMIVQTQNSSGEALVVGETADVTFVSSSDTGEFFNESGTNQPVDYMASNWKNRKFRYRDSTEGEHTITVTVTIQGGGESWSASQDITIGDEPEEEPEDDDEDEEISDDEDEEVSDDQDEDEEEADEEEENDEEETKKEEKKKVVPPAPKKAEVKPQEEISPELLLKLKTALVPQAPTVPLPVVTEIEPEPELKPLKKEEKLEKTEEKPEPATVEAESQVAAIVQATTSVPEPAGPIVIEKKLSWWQKFWQWLFGN